MPRAVALPSDDDLRRVWSDFQAGLASRGLRLYPGTPLLENSDRLPCAEWADDDWSDFLDIAEVVGTRLVYAEAVEADSETLEELIANIEHYDADGQHSPIAGQLRGHLDDLYRIEAGFMNQGLYHQWAIEADWWVAAEHILDELRPSAKSTDDDEDDDLDVDYEERHALYARIESEGWIREIARDRGFLLADPWSSEEERIVAELLGVHLGQVVEPKGDGRALVRHVSSQARRIFQSEVRDELQDEAMEQVPHLAAELAQLHDDWAKTTVSIREGYARRLVKDRFGYAFSLVVKKVARHKEASNAPSLFS